MYDFDRLREDLKDYFRALSFMINPYVMMEVFELDNVSEDYLIKIATENNFNLDNYLILDN